MSTPIVIITWLIAVPTQNEVLVDLAFHLKQSKKCSFKIWPIVGTGTSDFAPPSG